jgi:hypothetical protein
MGIILNDISTLIYETDLILYIEEKQSVDAMLKDLKDSPASKDKSIIDKDKLSKAKAKQEEVKKKLLKSGVPQKMLNKKRKFGPDLIQNIIDEMKETGIFKSIGIGGIILFLVYQVQANLSLFFMNYVDEDIAIFISLVILAPVTEELGKFYASKFKATGGHFIAFNAFEFSKYIMMFAGSVPIFSLLVARTLAVGLHLVNTMIHKKGREESIKKNDPSIAQNSLMVTILIHAAWNGLIGGGIIFLIRGLS